MSERSSSIVVFSYFRYQSVRAKFWAFMMMQFAHRSLSKAPGLQFYKLLGSGSGDGFRPGANLAVYGLLSVWDNESDADRFLAHSRLFARYRRQSQEQWQIYLRPLLVRGEWDAHNPFGAGQPDHQRGPIAVLTRATIRLSRLHRFWREVPPVSQTLRQHPGMIYGFGVGEWPLVQMATFSLWESEKAMQQYAYRSQAHRVAIARTQEIGWFSEEMYARFRPYRSEGTWGGHDPLQPYLSGCAGEEK
jgi:hypothetical protein